MADGICCFGNLFDVILVHVIGKNVNAFELTVSIKNIFSFSPFSRISLCCLDLFSLVFSYEKLFRLFMFVFHYFSRLFSCFSSLG